MSLISLCESSVISNYILSHMLILINVSTTPLIKEVSLHIKWRPLKEITTGYDVETSGLW